MTVIDHRRCRLCGHRVRYETICLDCVDEIVVSSVYDPCVVLGLAQDGARVRRQHFMVAGLEWPRGPCKSEELLRAIELGRAHYEFGRILILRHWRDL